MPPWLLSQNPPRLPSADPRHLVPTSAQSLALAGLQGSRHPHGACQTQGAEAAREKRVVRVQGSSSEHLVGKPFFTFAEIKNKYAVHR